jgi:hypothetical protein
MYVCDLSCCGRFGWPGNLGQYMFRKREPAGAETCWCKQPRASIPFGLWVGSAVHMCTSCQRPCMSILRGLAGRGACVLWGFDVQTRPVWCGKRCVAFGGAFPPCSCLSGYMPHALVNPSKATAAAVDASLGLMQGIDSGAIQACRVLCGPLCCVCVVSPEFFCRGTSPGASRRGEPAGFAVKGFAM